MPSAFVTGGTGFIGSHLVEELIRRGYDEVRCLVRTDRKWLDGLPIKEVKGDLFDDALLRNAVRDVDYVYHNGAVTRARGWDAFRKNNVDAAVRLVQTVADVNPGLERLVVTSSLAAVGRCQSGVAHEDSPLRPVSMYGRSKAIMEEEVWERFDGLPITIVRPPSVYGPREQDIFTFFQTINKGICPVVGDVHGPALNLVYVDDLVRGMVDAAQAPETVGETYFIGSERQYSWGEIKNSATAALGKRALTIAIPPPLVTPIGAVVESISALTGSYPPLNREKAREIRHACKMCSVGKAKNDFGYEQRMPLDQGMDRTIAWYKREGWL